MSEKTNNLLREYMCRMRIKAAFFIFLLTIFSSFPLTAGSSDVNAQPVYEESLSPPNITVEMNRYFINTTFYPPVDPREELVEGTVTCKIPARAKPNVRCLVDIKPFMMPDHTYEVEDLYFTKDEIVKTFSFIAEADSDWSGDSVRYIDLNGNWYYEGARGSGPVMIQSIEINILPVVIIDIEVNEWNVFDVISGKSLEISLDISNTGNVEDTVLLKADTTDDSTHVEFLDDEITVKPNVKEKAYLWIFPDKDHPPGEISVHVDASSKAYQGTIPAEEDIEIEVKERYNKEFDLWFVVILILSLIVLVSLISIVGHHMRKRTR
jgi:hypothetical protein